MNVNQKFRDLDFWDCFEGKPQLSAAFHTKDLHIFYENHFIEHLGLVVIKFPL